ncbi:MAG: hypothetical protein OXG47_04055 [bacterium]|nr:hypothetical protein [bacterium]MCY3924294.1 hypothetical protein [bacterium]
MSSPPDHPPEAAAGPAARGYHAFEDPVHDRLLGVILALGAEVWNLRERLGLLESALARQGVEVSALIEELALDPERAPAMAADRDAFLARFLRAVSAD